MTTAVRAASRADVGAMAHTLVRAFHDDPVMMWLWPDADERARGLPIMFASLIRHHHLRHTGTEVAAGGDDTIGAVALWDPPGRWVHSRLTDIVMMPGLIRAFRSRLQFGDELARTMKRHHPDEPHWYLAMIGTDPRVRGTGYGRALLQSRLNRCDAERAPAYLESSKPENVGYYERFGFEVTGEIVLPHDGPTVWPMWRTPR